ncbi:MAG: hypothetical protein IJU95_08965 [Treponema sp.]|nr:hypothetical protein [Treponema sp.]
MSPDLGADHQCRDDIPARPGTTIAIGAAPAPDAVTALDALASPHANRWGLTSGAYRPLND